MMAMKGYKKISWTPRQVQVLGLLIKNTPIKQIQKETTASFSSIYKVKWFLSNDKIPPSVKKKVGMVLTPEEEEEIKLLPEENEEEENSEENEVLEDEEGGEKSPSGKLPPPKKKPVTNEGMKKQDGSSATLFQLFQLPTALPITPIMYNARFAANREWGWRLDIPWEDFFDTVLVRYFAACGIALQGYVRMDEEEEEAAPVEAREKAEDGNGHLDMDTLAKKVAENLYVILQSKQQ